MLRVGMIGSGFMGDTHAAAYKNVENARLVAVVSRNAGSGQKLASEYGCSYYQDAEEMLKKEDIHMVDICVPTYLHQQYVELAAKYHKHVLCEKPFGLSYESCKRMKEVCEEACVKLMVAQVVRFKPEILKIRKLLEEGTLGKIHMVTSNRLAQAPDWTTWHQDPAKSGGGLYDMHVHNVDLWIGMFGPVERVYSVGWKSSTGCWNHVTTTLRFKNGVQAVDETSLEMTGAYPFTFSMRIVGDRGTVDYSVCESQDVDGTDTGRNAVILYEKEKPPVKLQPQGRPGYEAEMESFADAVLSDHPVAISPDESLYVMKVMEAIRQSLETGREVWVD